MNFVFFTTLFLFEVPTGVVADVFGRKISFVCSCFLFSLGMFIYGASYSFWGFALAEATAAVGHTFASGAFQAWVVDRLKHYEYSGSLTRIFTRQHQIAEASQIIGAIIGAYLADKDMTLPWFVGGGIMFVGGLLATVMMKEEYFVRQSFSIRDSLQSMKNTIEASIQYGIKSNVVRFILLMGLVQFFAVQAPNMQWQPFFSQFIENRATLGFIFGGVCVSLIIGSSLAAKFLGVLKDEKLTLIVSQIAIGTGIIITSFMNLFPVALLVFLLHEVARGLFRPLKDTYLNDNIPSKERATLISFDSMSHHFGGMVGLLFSGFVAEYISIFTAWVLSGSILIGTTLVLMRNNKA